MSPVHDNEWTVATLKEYFDALRIEDQRAVQVLAKSVQDRLNIIIAIATLAIAVEAIFKLFGR